MVCTLSLSPECRMTISIIHLPMYIIYYFVSVLPPELRVSQSSISTFGAGTDLVIMRSVTTATSADGMASSSSDSRQSRTYHYTGGVKVRHCTPGGGLQRGCSALREVYVFDLSALPCHCTALK